MVKVVIALGTNRRFHSASYSAPNLALNAVFSAATVTDSRVSISVKTSIRDSLVMFAENAKVVIPAGIM